MEVARMTDDELLAEVKRRRVARALRAKIEADVEREMTAFMDGLPAR